jgi:carnitine monooxygenase subunit
MTDLPYPPDDPERLGPRGLPAWTYHSPALFALERERLFLTHWQVSAMSAISRPGDWLAYDMLGERAVVMRGQDGGCGRSTTCAGIAARGWSTATQGHCKGAIVCPFHGWVYNLDGTLRGAAQPTSFGEMTARGVRPEADRDGDLPRLHLPALPPGPQPSVATLLAPFAPTSPPTGLRSLLPVTVPNWSTELPVNWKSVRDVDNEGYHVPLAHPGLQELYGRTYRDLHLEGRAFDVERLWRCAGAAGRCATT